MNKKSSVINYPDCQHCEHLFECLPFGAGEYKGECKLTQTHKK